MRERQRDMLKRRYADDGERSQIRFRLRSDLVAELRTMAKSRRITLNRLIEEALDEALHPLNEAHLATILSESASDTRNRVQSLQQELECLGDVFGFFLFQWFASTPPIPDERKHEVAEVGRERYLKFLGFTRERLMEGKLDALVAFMKGDLSEPQLPPIPKKGAPKEQKTANDGGKDEAPRSEQPLRAAH